MDGTLHKISFLKLQGRGGGEAPITLWGWMGVDVDGKYRLKS